ncbi:ParB/RepB/Spo0J family partition protein [Sphingobium chungbukense]|uniref:Chromosome partitioning protein ParB n=1 Tax=Sphingobium chungbukense TaxID=56193 RepID=A0A0M3AP49_9SPHN|nr:ParB/RepB/Spo0J family partition protein [Sphingobium chungbukense]KKW91698.1 chromosome partitioning protein ParB [Sphingobium chungbukense]
MARFIRDILAALSYEPPVDKGPVDQESLSRLDQRLAPFADKGAGPRSAMAIQPGECSVWDGNPRDQPGLTAENCRSLIDSIASEGGNRIPVLVRLNPPGSDRPYQLLVGSRRRFAVDWLNHHGRPDMRLSALVVDLSDEEAFRLADIENRERADISELDRARSYQNAVDRFYGGVQSRMAEALNLSNSQLSRLLALAQLPEEVVGAFATRDELRVRYSELLTPLLRRPDQRGRMVAEARLIGEQQQTLALQGERMIPPATVLARLREAATPHAPEDARDIAIIAGGTRIGRAKASRSGGLTVDLSIAEDADLDELLARLRETIVAVRGV